jgi:hypothetical protein
MGKAKKGFNWKARQQPDVTIDRSSEKEVCMAMKIKIQKIS